MNLDREDIRARDEHVGRGPGEESGFIRSIDDARGWSRKSNISLWHVVAEHFDPIQINDAAVIAPQPDQETSIERRISDREAMAKISGDVFGICIRAKADCGG